MPLHRDIYWVGRQWAVTGHGMQAIDQKQKSKFDIEVARLWDDDLAEGLSSERWFNLADFSEGLAIARARYPAPPDRSKPKPAPPHELLSPPNESAATADVSNPSQPESQRQAQPRSEPRKSTPDADPAKSNPAKFAMRIDGGRARFTSMWRVRIKC